MPESITGLADLVAAGGGTAAAGTDAALAADGSVVAGTAAEGTAGAAAATGGSAAAGGGGFGSLAAGAGKVIGTAALTAGVNSLMAPKRPDLPAPVAMPDPQAQEAARQKAIADMISRRGRASTIMTSPAGSGTLGG